MPTSHASERDLSAEWHPFHKPANGFTPRGPALDRESGRCRHLMRPAHCSVAGSYQQASPMIGFEIGRISLYISNLELLPRGITLMGATDWWPIGQGHTRNPLIRSLFLSLLTWC